MVSKVDMVITSAFLIRFGRIPSRFLTDPSDKLNRQVLHCRRLSRLKLVELKRVILVYPSVSRHGIVARVLCHVKEEKDEYEEGK